MSKFLKPLIVTLVASSYILVGCSKPPPPVVEPPPPPPVVEEVPPPPPPPPPPPAVDPVEEVHSVLQTIYFNYDKSDLLPESISKLERIASALQQYPTVNLLAEGYADERGSSEYNMGLGENRAKSVQNYLTSYGISSSRIDVTSYGEERPVQSGCSNEDCHSLNRRVEWQVR